MFKAKVVEFFENKKIVSGICIGHKGSRMHILTEDGKELTLNQHRILHCSSFSVDLQLSRNALIERLWHIKKEQKRFEESVDSRALWEILLKEGKCFDLRMLSEIVFGKQANSNQEAAVLRVLVKQRPYFKLQGKAFYINSPEKAEMIKSAIEREMSRKHLIEEGVMWLQSVIDGKEIASNNREKFISLLKEFIIHGNAAEDAQLVRQILSRTKTAEQKTCFTLLVKLGIWDEDENLLLYKYEVPTQWPEPQRKQVNALANCYENILKKNKRRKDFTAVSAFSIDDPYTTDVDDAISFEPEGDIARVGIHITDVASSIMLDSPLDREAARRATSIYLPDGKIPMIPVEVSENLLSLEEGKKKAAVSILVSIDKSGEILEYNIFPSIISIKKRLTYREVDARLRDESVFSGLYRIASLLRQKRIASGAMVFPIPDIQIMVDKAKRITLQVRERETPSQVIVSELMIAANYLTGLFFKENNCPVLYRRQSEQGKAAVLEENPSLFQLFQARKYFTRTEITTEPGPHHGLGLNVYAPITSPLRKYFDLITQRQLLCLLSGEKPVYNDRDLNNIASKIEPLLIKARIVEQERKRYWLLKILQNKLGQSLKAVVLERRYKGWSILLYDYLLECFLQTAPQEELLPGKDIEVVVKKSDPFYNILKVELSG